MQHLEVSGAVRPIYRSLGVKRLSAQKSLVSVHSTCNQKRPSFSVVEKNAYVQLLKISSSFFTESDVGYA